MKKIVKVILIFMLFPTILLGCNETKPGDTNGSNNNNNEVTLEPYKSGASEETGESSNSKIEMKDARLFYYDAVSDKLLYMDTKVEVKEKAVVSALISALKQPVIDGIDPLLDEDVAVKSAKLDNETGTLFVDFKSKIIDHQKVGSGPESNILKALVNTLGSYYKVDKVILTIDGNPYESGHIIMKKDEAFKVDTKSAEKA